MRVDVGGYELEARVHAADRPGAGAILLHGMAGTAADWEPVLPAFAHHMDALTVDLLGHGASDAPADPDLYSFDAMADALVRLADHLGMRAPVWVGYSFGGRMLLNLALRHPDRVGSLILESVHPGLLDPAERARRAQLDEEDARLLERDGLAAFLDRWHERPLFASRRRDAARWADEVDRKLRTNSVRGLALCLRRLGLGAQPWLLGRVGALRQPSLVMAGSLDPAYVNLARSLHESLSASRLKVALDVGHAVHVEDPQAWMDAVQDFLDRLASPSPPLMHAGGR